jgi:hypothetical protein
LCTNIYSHGNAQLTRRPAPVFYGRSNATAAATSTNATDSTSADVAALSPACQTAQLTFHTLASHASSNLKEVLQAIASDSTSNILDAADFSSNNTRTVSGVMGSIADAQSEVADGTRAATVGDSFLVFLAASSLSLLPGLLAEVQTNATAQLSSAVSQILQANQTLTDISTSCVGGSP